MRNAKEESRKGGFELRKGAGLQCLIEGPMKTLPEKQLLSNEMKKVRELAGSCLGKNRKSKYKGPDVNMGLVGAGISEEAKAAGAE